MRRVEGVSGIYAIVNLINGKYYVGSSYNLLGSQYGRLPEHDRKLRQGKHDNDHLRKACAKYGKENFVFFIIEYVEPSKLTEVEQKYLDVAKTHKGMVYNKKFTAEKTGPMEEETKKKMSDAHKALGLKGEKHHGFGVPMKQETKDKISRTTKGKKHKPEHRAKLAEINKRRKGIPRPNFQGNKNPDYNSTIYTFWNFIDDFVFIGAKYEFRKKFNYKRGACDAVLSGKTNTIGKKWVITHIHIDGEAKKLNFRLPSPETNTKYDHTIYEFFNKKTKESFIGTRFNFCLKYQLKREKVAYLINKSKDPNGLDGWIFILRVATAEQKLESD